MIGLLTVFMLRAYGIRIVDVVEPREERRALALQLGARAAFSPQEMMNRSELYPVGIECSSRNVAFELLQRRMQYAGRICILADGNIEPLVLAPAFHEKELSMVGRVMAGTIKNMAGGILAWCVSMLITSNSYLITIPRQTTWLALLKSWQVVQLYQRRYWYSMMLAWRCNNATSPNISTYRNRLSHPYSTI